MCAFPFFFVCHVGLCVRREGGNGSSMCRQEGTLHCVVVRRVARALRPEDAGSEESIVRDKIHAHS